MLKPAKLIKNEDTLGADDRLKWSVLDSQSALSPEFPPPFPEFGERISLKSSGGMEVNVSVPAGKLARVNQNTFFPGTFNIGDVLLFTGFYNPGPLVFEFSSPVYGIGASIQSDPQVPAGTPGPFPFTAIVEAFNSEEKSLGEFKLPGMSKIQAGSETTLIALFQEQGEIAKVSVNVIENNASIPFAINMLKLKTHCNFVPEKGFGSIKKFIEHFA